MRGLHGDAAFSGSLDQLRVHRNADLPRSGSTDRHGLFSTEVGKLRSGRGRRARPGVHVQLDHIADPHVALCVEVADERATRDRYAAGDRARRG